MSNIVIVIFFLLGITIALGETPFSHTFISPTAPPSLYNLTSPPSCLEDGQNYNEILTGYENYLPCANAQTRYINYIAAKVDVILQKEITSLETRAYKAVTMWEGYRGDAVPNFEKISMLMPNIEKLTIVNHKIDTLDGLGNLKNLKYLGLVMAYVQDWSKLENLKNIETLNLACSNIDNSDLKYISQLSTVKTLILDGTKVSDLSVLSNMTNLQNLLVKVTNIENEEQLDILKPLGLRWISFAPELSMPYITKMYPDKQIYGFVTSASTRLSDSNYFVDTKYPSRDCAININARVW